MERPYEANKILSHQLSTFTLTISRYTIWDLEKIEGLAWMTIWRSCFRTQSLSRTCSTTIHTPLTLTWRSPSCLRDNPKSQLLAGTVGIWIQNRFSIQIVKTHQMEIWLSFWMSPECWTIVFGFQMILQPLRTIWMIWILTGFPIWMVQPFEYWMTGFFIWI